MQYSRKPSRHVRIAGLVRQLAVTIDARRLSRGQAQVLCAELDNLVALLDVRRDADARDLAEALLELREALADVERRARPRRADVAANRRLDRTLRRIALIITAGATLAAPLAAAAATADPALPPTTVGLTALPAIQVGDPVLNPVTGLDEEVVEIISPAVVRTDAGNFILLATEVGDSFTNPEDGETYTVVIPADPANGVFTVTVSDSNGDNWVVGLVTDKSGEIAGVVSDPDGDDGSGAGDFDFPPSAGDVNNYVNARRGNNGGDGKDGAGVKVCVPLVGCAKIGKDPSRGGDGAGGPTVTAVVDETNWGDVQTVSDGLPGIVASSVGGNGGQGGDAWGNIDGAAGGKAGRGGDISLDASVTVTTSGDGAHGIFAQSRSGRGGEGGTGYIASGGGGGGSAGQGGTVAVDHSGRIRTEGDGAVGILAQSLGGAAGGGGDSYGVIGEGGGGTAGGHGGRVTVDHAGVVETHGDDAHGILAQSIGGSGGNAGASGGIVTFGDDGAAGGDGGQANVIARTGSSVLTTGDGSHALFAQSIGGGGGNGGREGGAVTLGSSGGAGGDGGQAGVMVESGAHVSTTGNESHAVFAQSVGGGGGDSGVSSGAVTLGAAGDGGGDGGDVTVVSNGVISTEGVDSRGVFAQSVGGGGGAARGTGAAVALGGGGAAGGDGGDVVVRIGETGSIHTGGQGGHGLFAQSVGGGGGSGSSAGGVIALGGRGGGGGSGGTVEVVNAGEIVTTGLEARGVFAQSVGGGGGSGGSGGGLATIGGSGGGLSVGGDVSVSNTGRIDTSGHRSSAIQAQSVGGGGGDGGSTGGVLLTIGGAGAAGGSAGVVTVEHGGDLSTRGDDSHGVFAQSVGGGGGSGGASGGMSAFGGVAIGGAGGLGGDGGEVQVSLLTQTTIIGGSIQPILPFIVTRGDRSRGVFVQSVGGGGGDGGFAAQVSHGYGASARASVGGAGGDGGEGGVVHLVGDALIHTEGASAQGLFAQSVGGGGGNGGLALTYSYASGEVAAGALAISIGGSGGKGGGGGRVEVESGGAILTEGQFSTGLLVQSTGGGGGNGGFSLAFAGAAGGIGSAAAAVGIGGSGGQGGDGGAVDASFDGAIGTLGDDAGGAVIQSVGGGGGNGGFGVAGAVALGGGGGGAGAAGVGGSGGDGGDGDAVTGAIGGPVETTGDRAGGVTIQSLGGGGGNGGFSVAGAIGGGGIFGGAVSVGVGGSGGGGGDGGAVIGQAQGAVRTTGEQSAGVTIQSVGGGGGAGGFNVTGAVGGAASVGGAVSVGVGGAGGQGGDGGTVQASAGSILTEGDQSDGLVAQSVGGGGGRGGFAIAGGVGVGGSVGAGVSVGVGGSGGGGGDGARVDAAVAGDVITLGENANAITAQSLGGGGGSGAFAIAGGVTAGGSAGGSVGVGVGGSGGDGGDGEAVSLDLVGQAATTGAGSDALLVQSVGGGGGAGGFSITGDVALSGSGAGTVGVAVGGSGGGGGDAGAVVLRVNDGVAGPDDALVAAVTLGDGARAVAAQSIGGGGGAGGFSILGGVALAANGAGNLGVGVGGSGGDGGDSASVFAEIAGDVLTAGDDASAVLAQSVGGGGGAGGFNISGGLAMAGAGAGNLMVGVGGFGGDGGDAGSVEGGVAGDIVTEGDRAFGAAYQSIGGGGGAGGLNVTGAVSLTQTSGGAAANLGVGVGGFGGGGGAAGSVNAALTGDVFTDGLESFGALLQSVGGGGGAGGLNITGALSMTVDSTASVAVGVGVGGFGGDGGDAADVGGTVTGRYVTAGRDADGVVAQSIGGGGGAGGLDVAGGLAVGAGATGAVGVGIGGFGGGGGDAGAVSLVRIGDTFTQGAASSGVIGQSVGGGGGAGGVNISGGLADAIRGDAGSLAFGLGGFGGGGGDADAVSVSVTGSVVASGLGSDVRTEASTLEIEVEDDTVEVIVPGSRRRLDGSHGVVAQSVGGGGGAGAMNVTGSIALAPPAGGGRAAALGVGGFGGAGGDAGAVDLTVTAPGEDRVQVGAIGDGSIAVMAQSIGGGGGAGGVNVSGSLSTNGQLTAGVGGFGGDGGLGRDVSVRVDADLFAAGNGARGVSAQSVGGGGGSGGIDIAGGLQSASTGGEPALTFGVGGFGGAGDASGDVAVSQNGLVMVEGVDSIGVLAQSVGGGGGSGGLNVSGDLSLKGAGMSRGFTVAAGVGGAGGVGSDAGDVRLDSVGDILVNALFKVDPEPGEDRLESAEFTGGSVGVLAQSIGGGGGLGGVNVTGVIAPSGNPAAFGVGGSGGSGGDAGKVVVDRGDLDPALGEAGAAGLIRTFGDDSDGLVAQSVGGGGGRAGMNLVFAASNRGPNSGPTAMIAVGGDGAGAGRGDTVDVRHHGAIVTQGAASDGLVAQSIGGGGGDANFNLGLGLLKGANAINFALGGATGAGGVGGDVTVDHLGAIMTVGDQSIGIRAQSIGGGGGNAALNVATSLLSGNAVSLAIGRLGGEGGEGGDVRVAADGVIDTSGRDSHGVFAQSVGGGGGLSGAISVGGQKTIAGGASPGSHDGNVAIGLEGGRGATGGEVTVDIDGSVTTRGEAARGVFAQSIGGGGGAGGAAVNIIFGSAGSATVGVGGAGGEGAVSGRVGVVNNADIVTAGARADGVLAQSIGGGGGVGGYAATAGLQVGESTGPLSRVASVNVGGVGGTGARGERVEVVNQALIATQGDEAYGVRAQSIGGGGGVGGAVINVRAQGAQANNSLELNIGGSGGEGGAGGAVDVLNEGLIFTSGRGAAGVSANSIGGGGGDAGVVLDVVAGYAGLNNQSHRFVLNIGGDGGIGGVGGSVSVTNRDTGAEHSGRIVTLGDDAHGVFAQSVGGGGGNGSSIVSIAALATGANSSAVGLSLGGAGGSGNRGGLVEVINAGLIDTSGAGAHGVLAQSIGGGGGNGGMAIGANIMLKSPFSAPLVSIGGDGGAGGDGGQVTVTNTGAIVTRGDRAHGLVAQSIGGGGGNAGMGFGPVTGALGLADTVAAVVGRTGGEGGTGGAVVVHHAGDITVLGDGALAIKAESINGGGGTLHMNFDGVVGLPGVPFVGANGEPERADPVIAARAGAEGVHSMNAGSVTVNSTGTFGLAGDNGVGAFHQAIGGGGGTIDLVARLSADMSGLADPAAPLGFDIDLGGLDGQDNRGGDIVDAHVGLVLSEGRNSLGGLTQSIGGGGGRAVIDLTVPDEALLGTITLALGGRDGVEEAGGDIDHEQSGGVLTLGELSVGAMLQSIGGGGGSAGIIVESEAIPASGVAAASLTAPTGASMTTTLGAVGGTGLAGGAVSTDFSGGFQTAGDSAIGLIVQSIGAGGGEVRASGVASVSATLGGSAGASGDGGDIQLRNDGAILTAGERAHGVVLQSIGGGGGAVFGGFAQADVVLNADNGGDGGAVGFDQIGDIVVTGDQAFGVIAQSLGGGGGWVDGAFAGSAGGAGAGGTLDLSLSGAVFAAGQDSIAVFAQSMGANGGGDIDLTLDGLVRGGSGQGAGVRLDGGAANMIRGSGSISAVSGLAIETTTGDDRVLNDGRVIGNIDLGAGDNAFVNELGSSFVAFETIDLRDGSGDGTFTNAGDFIMGLSASAYPIDLAAGEAFGDLDQGDPTLNPMYGARVINTVDLDGDYVQTGDGHLAFDVAFGPYASDRVDVSGDAAVDGTGDVVLTWLETADPVTLFATGGVGVDNGLDITDTLALDYSVRSDADGIQLSFVSDFGQPFLNANGRELGRHIDSALRAGGSSGIGRLAALVGNLQAGDETLYSQIFAELNPESLMTPLVTQLTAAESFAGQTFGCVAPTDRLGRQCVWARVEGAAFEREGDGDHHAFRDRETRLRAGFEQPIDDAWSFAGAVGFDRINRFTVVGRAQIEGQALHGSVGLQRTGDDGLRFGASLSGGWQWMEAQRGSAVFQPGVGASEPESGYLLANGGLSYVARSGRLFVRPALNVSATALHQAAFSETGLAGLGVEGLSETQVFGAINPELAVGVVFAETATSHATLQLTAAGVLRSDDEIRMPYRLLGSNPGADPAMIGSILDQEAWRLGADLRLVSTERIQFSFTYAAEFGERTDSQAAGMNLRIRF